jgi:hypothetical protein
MGPGLGLQPEMGKRESTRRTRRSDLNFICGVGPFHLSVDFAVLYLSPKTLQQALHQATSVSKGAI